MAAPMTDHELHLAIMTALEHGLTPAEIKAQVDECVRIIREEMPWIRVA